MQFLAYLAVILQIKLRHAQYLRPSLFPVQFVANDIVTTSPH